jgi:hypothetical protein
MGKDILAKVDDQINKYKADHQDETPLYILVSSEEEKLLLNEVRRVSGLDSDDMVTTYKESKILRYEALQKGQLLLTNELPETGS